jgi:hypothetical protein
MAEKSAISFVRTLVPFLVRIIAETYMYFIYFQRNVTFAIGSGRRCGCCGEYYAEEQIFRQLYSCTRWTSIAI